MQKKKPCYLKAVVIVHGKSEKQICEYIKSNLRLKMEIVGKEKGEKSIQINSLKHILGDYRFNSFESFVSFYDDVEVLKNSILPSRGMWTTKIRPELLRCGSVLWKRNGRQARFFMICVS